MQWPPAYFPPILALRIPSGLESASQPINSYTLLPTPCRQSFYYLLYRSPELWVSGAHIRKGEPDLLPQQELCSSRDPKGNRVIRVGERVWVLLGEKQAQGQQEPGYLPFKITITFKLFIQAFGFILKRKLSFHFSIFYMSTDFFTISICSKPQTIS